MGIQIHRPEMTKMVSILENVEVFFLFSLNKVKILSLTEGFLVI